MVTLKELVYEQEYQDISDMEVIKFFLTQNNLEDEAIEMIAELSASKVRKLMQKQEVMQTWITYLPSKYLYENYKLDVADRLHSMELDYLVNGCELSSRFMKWAKENVPNIKEPECYFRPLIEYLEENGVNFQKGKRHI